MGIRLKSLSEDAVDTYTHTWSVLVFLLLAFILLFVPSKQSGIEHGQLPELEAKCWCPSEFEDSQVSYANAFCSGYLTSVFQGTLDPAASDSFLYTSPKIGSKGPERVEGKRESEKEIFVLGSAQEHCSLFLFILAICLRLPQTVWSILSGCCNTFNVAQTLQSVESGNSMHYDGRQQRYASLMRAFIDYTHRNQSRKAATCLYLVMKVLMLVVIIVEIALVAIFIFPQLPIFAWSGPIKELHMHKRLPVYRCSITTVNYENVPEDRSVQCYLTERPQTHQRQLLVENPMTSSNVFLIALTNLAVLFLLNAFNTVQWLVTLVSESTRYRLGLRKDAPLDLVFLVQMAQANLSVDVAVGLAEALNGGPSAEADDQEIMLQKRM